MTSTTSTLKFDMDLFTLGEYADLCDAAGVDPQAATEGKLRVTMQTVPALYWILRRRSEPALTLEQVRGLGASVIQEIPDLIAAASGSRVGPTATKSRSKRSGRSSTSTPATPSSPSPA